MDRQPQTVALIPANDEEMSIAGVVLQAHRYVDKVTVCDCGSRDKIGEIAEALGATVIKHEQNMGYKATLSMLLEEARKLDLDVMVTLDADGQHDLSYIPKLIEPILRGKADM